MNVSSATMNDLAKACARSADAAEWGELVRRCMPLASLVAMRVSRMWLSAPSPATVDDIVQEIFLKLCERERRILRDFEPRGEDSFLGLLRLVSASVANDYFRRQYSAKRGGKVVTMPLLEDGAQILSATMQSAVEMRKSTLMEQLDRKLRSAPEVIGERDRAFFWLYYRQGFTAEEIAGMAGSGLTSKGVESALRRVTLWLRAAVDRNSEPEVVETG
jgi:RNA polymerase sigma factor (sigma-70 family)